MYHVDDGKVVLSLIFEIRCFYCLLFVAWGRCKVPEINGPTILYSRRSNDTQMSVHLMLISWCMATIWIYIHKATNFLSTKYVLMVHGKLSDPSWSKSLKDACCCTNIRKERKSGQTTIAFLLLRLQTNSSLFIYLGQTEMNSSG